MRIKLFGWEHKVLSQIQRIREGLINLGHEIVEENPDVIYCNNDFFDEPLEYSKKYPNSIKIFNILDLQIDNPTYDLYRLEQQLLQANFVTCISKNVGKQIRGILNIDAININNPAKDINYIPDMEKSFPFLYVGRARCPNKRFNLIQETFKLTNWRTDLIRVCGSEPPACGIYEGIVDDNYLNLLYNQAGVTLLPSKFEGLGLPGIESLICGTPVIECSDNSTAHEFIPKCMICDPTPESILGKIKEINDDYNKFKNIALEYGEKYKVQFNKNTIAQNIINLIK